MRKNVLIALLICVLILLEAQTIKATLINNGDGTVTDTVTCLQWEQNTPFWWGESYSVEYRYAISHANNLFLAGRSDWRLPTVDELSGLHPLSTLFHYGSGRFWSSTPYDSYQNFTFNYSLGYSQVGSTNYGASFGESSVRAVRGGVCSPGYVGHISQTPMSGGPGTSFTRTGQGFTPNSTVTLHSLDNLGNPVTPMHFLTDSSGGFSLNHTTSVDLPEGTYVWWVVDDSTGTTSQLLGYNIFTFSGESTAIPTGEGSLFENLPTITWPKPFGELTNEGPFDPTKDTFVIIHGWNTTDSYDLPAWVTEMGSKIRTGTNSSAIGSNVFYWNWMVKAKSKIPNWKDTEDTCTDLQFIPSDETEESGINMVLALIRQLPPSYDKNIHFIGHSLGSMVSTYAAKFAKDRHLPFANNINHLTFLDPPCYGGAPGGEFISENKNSIFIDNYISQVAPKYKDVDTNVWLTGRGREFNVAQRHSYSRYWYLSSVTNFDNKDILNDSYTPEGTIRLGFRWWEESSRTFVKTSYLQLSGPESAHWSLIEGEPHKLEKYNPVTIIEDAALLYKEVAVETAAQVVDYAAQAKKKITIVGVNTYNSVADTAGYVVDTAEHAWQNFHFIELVHSSTAVLEMPINIPEGANALTFGVQFLIGEPGSLLEVFVNDIPVYHTTSDRLIGEGFKLIPWIDVASYAGKKANVTLRLSNPNENTEGKIKIDDLLIAKIEDPEIIGGDVNDDGNINFIDTILSLQAASGQFTSDYVFPRADINNDSKIGVQEAIYTLRKVSEK